MKVSITSLKAFEILDSRGNPTLEVVMAAENGLVGKALVPSGASTGEKEAVELRDKDPKRYGGKGVLKAIAHVNGPLNDLLKGKNALDQALIDQAMIQFDGTPNKARMGANAILGVSMAACRLAAASSHLPLYRYLNAGGKFTLPIPMMNIINGGVHADNGLYFQEFLIRPKKAPSFKEAVRCGSEIFHTLKSMLKAKGQVTAVGDEGGFAPRLKHHEEALDLISEAVIKAGYSLGHDVGIALDCAASEFYDAKTKLYMNQYTTDQMIDTLATLAKQYAIDSIEDPLDQNDWSGFEKITAKLGHKLQIIGDDIFVTHLVYLKEAVERKAANAILIKPNQVGTVTETLQTISEAKKAHFKTIISHRSGETEDTFIADLAVATCAGQIKTGSLSRSERVAKYNRLMEIENELG